jgi:chromosome partitioning protein
MGRIVAVANQKGGVGKTTTVVNLCAFLADKGKKTLMVDMDPQGNATTSLMNKGEIKLSSYDMLVEDAETKDVVVRTKLDNFDIIPTTINLAGAEIELVTSASREFFLKNKLDEIKDDYDYIIIDCPPSLGIITINCLTAADSILVPIQCEYYSLEGVSQLLNTIRLVQKHLNSELRIDGVVLTMLDARTNSGFQVVEDVKNYFRDRVYSSIIPRNVRLSEAPSHRMTIREYDVRSKGAELYSDLADEFIKRNEEITA